MSAKPVMISQDDPLDSLLEGLEATASGISSDSGVSLNQAVRNFMANSQRARRAQTDVIVADESAPTIAFTLFHHLRNDGFKPELLVCVGFTGDLKDCSANMEDAIREFGSKLIAQDLIHFVVRVGNIILDLGYRRLGSDYMNSNNTMFNMFKRYWKSINEVPGAQRMRNEDFLRFARQQVDKSALKKVTSANKSIDGNLMAATAASVVNAFTGAKRNRRVRTVTAATATTPAKIVI